MVGFVDGERTTVGCALGDGIRGDQCFCQLKTVF
jgi:hypothetical protein